MGVAGTCKGDAHNTRPLAGRAAKGRDPGHVPCGGCVQCAQTRGSQSLHVDSRHATVAQVVDEWRVASSMWPVIECVDGGRSLYEYRQKSTWAICQNRINEHMGGITKLDK